MTVMNSLPFSSKATLPCFVSHTTATPCKSSVRSQGGSCKCLAPPLSPGNCFHSPGSCPLLGRRALLPSILHGLTPACPSLLASSWRGVFLCAPRIASSVHVAQPRLLFALLHLLLLVLLELSFTTSSSYSPL